MGIVKPRLFRATSCWGSQQGTVSAAALRAPVPVMEQIWLHVRLEPTQGMLKIRGVKGGRLLSSLITETFEDEGAPGGQGKDVSVLKAGRVWMCDLG